MKMARYQFAGLLVGLAIGMSGCGGGPKKATVVGVVTFEGKSITAGMIGFIPADGQPYQSDIQSDGSYRVENVPVGECIVVIHAPPPSDVPTHKAIKELVGAPPPSPPPPPFPTRYSDMGLSELRYTVVPGENVYKAEMKR